MSTIKKQNQDAALVFISRIQFNFLRQVDAQIKKLGYSPSLRELSVIEKVNITSVSQRIEALIRHGYLNRVRGIARSLVITEEGRRILDKSSKAERA